MIFLEEMGGKKMKKFKSILFTTLHTLTFLFLTPIIVQGSVKSDNAALKEMVGTQISEVLGIWLKIGSASMVLPIIAGALLIITGAGNPRIVTTGKALVLGSGITIALLLSSYGVTKLMLSIFGLSL